MISFRGMALALAMVLPPAAAVAAGVGDDGLHKQEWLTITFRDFVEDMATARAEGKRLAITIEQRGCIYCRAMHEELLADPEVRNYIREHFMVVQYNMFGDEEVTDLDGETLTEKTAVRKWGYVFTPTIVFLPEQATPGKSVAEAAVATMPGAFGKSMFLNMFRWVNEKGYETEEHFQKYHARMLEEMRKPGKPVGDE